MSETSKMKKTELSLAAVPGLVEYYIDSERALNTADEAIREKNCVFCDIAHGEHPTTDLLHKVNIFLISFIGNQFLYKSRYL